MSTYSVAFASSIASSLLVCTTALADAPAQFVPIGFLDPDGFGPTIAYAMSADGSIVVGESNSPTGFQAFRWTQVGGIHGLGAFNNPGGQLSMARACSADGSVIVGSSLLPDSLNEDGSPFRWTQETGLV